VFSSPYQQAKQI